MLALIRAVLTGFVFFVGSAGILMITLIRPYDPKVSLIWARWVPPICLWLLAIKIELRNQHFLLENHPYVVVANHQHLLDVFTCASVLCTPIVAVGKKEVLKVPFFGTFFRRTGQIIINRKDHESAMESMSEAAEAMLQRDLSVWVFAEGTRSRNKPLQPFKKGAFHLAVQSQRPIIPIVVSSYYKTLRMNSWHAGKVIVEVLAPIPTTGKTAEDIEELLSTTHNQMAIKIEALNGELLRK